MKIKQQLFQLFTNNVFYEVKSIWLLLTGYTVLTFSVLHVWISGIQLCIIVHRVHKWRIQSVKNKYVCRIHRLVFTLKCFFCCTLHHLSFNSPCFWSPQYIDTCSHRTWCTPSGGDRGRCDVAFCLDRAPERGRIIWQFKSFLGWQVELHVFEKCSLKVWIQRQMWC